MFSHVSKETAGQPGSFPSGLCYIAAYLRQAGHTVTIHAPNITKTTMEAAWPELEKFKPDIVGVSSVTANFMEARKVVAEAKRRLGCPVIMGGHHTSALPRSTLEGLPVLDAVIIGEGEIPMRALAAEFDRTGKIDFSGIPGAAFIKDGQYAQNPLPDPIADLDSLPYPARDLVSGGAWQQSEVSKQPVPRSMIVSSRGCPGQCTFCANTRISRKFRARTPCNVVEEMEFLKNKYGTISFGFTDNCFTADVKRAYDICSLLIEKNLGVTWVAAGRVNNLLDEDFLERMKRAGCVGLTIGIETSSQQLSNLMKKGTTPEQGARCCVLLRKHGIPYYGGFMIGNEGETLKTALDTIAFASKLKPSGAVFSVTLPLPGTELFERFYKDFDRPDTDWANWGSQEFSQPYKPRHTALSVRTLEWLLIWANLRFYCNPFQLFRMLLDGMAARR